METYYAEQTGEIVLTYCPAEKVEPVTLRYERELPERMRKPEPTFLEKIRAAAAADDDPEWLFEFEEEEKPKKWLTRIFVCLSVAVILVCLGLGIWLLIRDGGSRREPLPPDAFSSDSILPDGAYLPSEEAAAETTIPRYPNGGSTLLQLAPGSGVLPELTPQEVFAKVNPAAVTVIGYQELGVGVGTGVVFSSDGYIVTNYHVIDGSQSCGIWFPYSADEYEALLVGYDEDKDLAVLKVDLEGIPAAEFGQSDELTVGDPVYAIGNPLGTELRNTFTNGLVSAVNRDMTMDDGQTMTLIQTNTALNSGNSGGPLINQYGQVVGINTIKMMSDYDTIEGLGFAIPTSLAQRWINELILYGELLPQPVLGLMISRIPTVLPDGTVGLRIEEVTAGLGGEKAGVLPGDYVVAFAGQPVETTDDILAIRRSLYVGDRVIIRLWRDGQYLELPMEMMASPD